MHGDASRLLLADPEEARDDILRRAAAVGEVQVQVLEASVGETLLLVLLAVQPHHETYADLVEQGRAILGGVDSVPIRVPVLRHGAREGKELVGDDPRAVDVVDAEHLLVSVKVEALHGEPSQLHSLREALQAVQDRQCEVAWASQRVPEWHQRRPDSREGRPSGSWRGAEDQHLVCTDEEHGVGSPLRVHSANVDDRPHGLARVCAAHLGFQHLAISIRHPQVQRAEIVGKRLVDQLVVDREHVPTVDGRSCGAGQPLAGVLRRP
mmetsp:Transcript_14926/g.43046  ORF Transcript_14926/g.43046 Transcript_14926/m.43046 type:complete len:266 (-) Transcript_14926:119-916(-)